MNEYTDFSVIYDALTKNVCYSARAKYFHSLLLKYGSCRKGRLLDLACGTGSMSFEMDKRGWTVIGCDSSCDMLAMAVHKQQKNPCRIKWICQSMPQLELSSPVDAVICALDSLNHLIHPKALFSTFQRVASSLKSGGVFIFDVNTPYKHHRILSNRTFVYDQEKVFLVWRNALRKNHIVRMELDFFVKSHGKYVRKHESIAERAYERAELCSLLSKANLTVKAIYAADTYHAPSPVTQRWIYVVKKEG